MTSLDAGAALLDTPRGPVQVAREGTGSPVLVSHGGPGGYDQGIAWCFHLRAAGCEVIAPSRPGYLRTPLDTGRTPEEQADLYATILDSLRIERAAVLGFSSGAISAVHFAARHPHRTTALLLDTPILLPFAPPVNRFQRAAYENGALIWLSYQVATRRPALMARLAIGGLSAGLSRAERKAAAHWISADRARLDSMRMQLASIAPHRWRAPGWNNDQANERDLPSPPFAAVTAPTLIALGTHDAIVSRAHATSAADGIVGAELRLVPDGHHLLSLSREYGPVARRQIELISG